jgi:hypothetical protein
MPSSRLLSLAIPLTLLLPACLADDSPDGRDEPGVTSGKADGTGYADCELAAVVDYLNAGPSADQLIEAGVHTLAADNLAAHRDGADGLFGTDDDRLFASIDQVDEVDYVGPVAIEQLVAAAASDCADEPADPWAAARDVTLDRIDLGELAAPDSYDRPSVDLFYLSGTEFWQKWSGGHSPTYSFSEGTDFGRRCMQASAIRFEAIMAEPPESIVRLRDETNWSGSFFNWNDDYAEADWGDASGARLWAWRTGLIKWISQTGSDGSCYLPTLELVEAAAADCLEVAEMNGDGEIQGCSAR